MVVAGGEPDDETELAIACSGMLMPPTIEQSGVVVLSVEQQPKEKQRFLAATFGSTPLARPNDSGGVPPVTLSVVVGYATPDAPSGSSSANTDWTSAWTSA